jgi:hypothetical protein
MGVVDYHQLQLRREVGKGRRLGERAALFDRVALPYSRNSLCHDFRRRINEMNSGSRVAVERASEVTQVCAFRYVTMGKLAIQ